MSALLDELKDALGATITAMSLTDASSLSDQYEAYIFGLIIGAAERQGASVWYEDVNGNRATYFCFRTSPGYIYSRRLPYTHAVIEFEGKPTLEVHMGVRFLGKSGVAHECDLSVLPRSVAQQCRDVCAIPRPDDLLMAIECKYYVESRISLFLARAFLGLQTELRKRETFFVSNIETGNAGKVLARHASDSRYEGIVPDDENQMLLMRAAFERVFDNFKVSYRNLEIES